MTCSVLLNPIIVLLGKNRSDKPDDGFAVQEATNNVSSPAELSV